jgi:cellulose synthase operon protein C
MRAIELSSRVVALVLLAALAGCGKSPAARLEAARALVAQAKYEPAQAELNKLIVDGEDTAESRELLARVALALGDYAAAEHHLSRAAELGANDPAFVELRVRVLFGAGKFTEALATLASSGKQLPPEERDLLEAEAAIGAGDPARAVALLAGPRFAAQPSARARVLRAQALAGSGDFAAARAVLTALLADEPAHPDASLILADLHLRDGDPVKALAVVDAALAQMPADKRDMARGSLLLVKADIALSSSREADAKLVLQELKKSFPDAAATNLLAARLAVLEGNSRDAVASLRQMLLDQPDNANIRMLLAVALIDSGNYNQAEQELVSMLARNPESSQARLGLARLQLLQGRLDSAQALLEGGQRGSEEIALLGEVKLRLGDNVAAIDLLRSSLAAKPRDAARALDLAEVYLQAGDAQQAADVLSRAIASNQAEDTRLKQLSFLTTVLGSGRDLARAIEDLVKRTPNDVNLRLLAAGVYSNALGQTDDARRQLQAARAIAPANTRVILALARLESNLGNRDAAQAAYLDALRLDKDDVSAIAGLAWLAGRRGDLGELASWRAELDRLSGPRVRVEAMRLSLLVGDQLGTTRAATALLQEATEPAIASYTVGSVYLDAGQPRPARDHLRAAAEARADVPEYWLKLAEAEIAMGEFVSAESHLAKALQIRRGWLPAVRLLVRVGLLQKNPERALKLVDDLRKDHREDWALQVLQADTLAAIGKFGDSLPLYEKALEREFDRAVMMRWIAARRAAGVADPARPLVARVERTPNDVTMRLLLANYYMSTSASAPAIDQYRKVLALQATNTLALNNLAWLLFDAHAGNLEEAISLSRRARQLEPQSAMILDTLGWLLHAAGKGPEALEVLTKAAALAPDNKTIGAHLSEVKNSTPRVPAANN